MKSVIVYGSTLGNCSNAAKLIAKELDGTAVFEVSDFDFNTVDQYDLILLGTSTWGLGDLQDDWESHIDSLKEAKLSEKRVALFGTGDQESYADTFVDAMRELYDSAKEAGADIVGQWSTDGYDYSDSRAEIDGSFVGLVLDEDNQYDLSEGRIKEWVAAIR